MKSIKTLIPIAALLLPISAQAAVVLDFNSGTDGFVADSAASVSQSGGRLVVTGATGGGDFYEAASRATTFSFLSGSAFSNELVAARANGGTISFNVSIPGSDIAWASAARPSVLEFQLTLDSGGQRDTEVGLLSVPGSSGTSSNTFTFNIVAGTGSQFNGTNTTINWGPTASGAISFGFKDGGDYITTANFSIDNVTVTAVPEPSAMAIGLVGMFGLVARRRR